MTDRKSRAGLAAIVFLAVLGSHRIAPAQDQEAFSMATVGDDAFAEFRGLALINQAAGDGNIQMNGTTVSLNGSGEAVSRTSVVQLGSGLDAVTEVQAIARILDDAFAEAQGVIQLSQAAGQGNLQINLLSAALGLNGEILVEAELSQSRSESLVPEPEETDGVRHTFVAESAFRDASGIIQVNQAAGKANTTFNRLVIGLASGATP